MRCLQTVGTSSDLGQAEAGDVLAPCGCVISGQSHDFSELGFHLL